MSPNGEAYLVNPDAPEGSARFPQARFAPSTSHRTLYVSGTACVRPTDGTWPGVTENDDGTLTLDIHQQTAAMCGHHHQGRHWWERRREECH